MKCAVYIRVSTDKEEQKTSLENQQRFFYNVITEKGWQLYGIGFDKIARSLSKKESLHPPRLQRRSTHTSIGMDQQLKRY